MLDIYASCPNSYENQSRPGVLNLGVGRGFHEPLEIVYKPLYEYLFIEGRGPWFYPRVM